MVDLTSDVALETADGLAAGLALGDASLDVVLCAFVPAQACDGDCVEGRVRLPVTATVEPAALCFAR